MSQLNDQVRKLIDASGESRYALWKTTGISQGQLSDFMAGERGIGLEAMERLLRHLGHEIVIRKIKKRGT